MKSTTSVLTSTTSKELKNCTGQDLHRSNSLTEGLSVPLRVDVSPIHGTGCFAVNMIRKGELIGEYTGQKISLEQAENLEEKDNGLTFTFKIHDDLFIDGSVFGNKTKFINHCCSPNCRVVISGEKAFYHASRDISPGEELTIDYDFDPEYRVYGCRCCHPCCRGYI